MEELGARLRATIPVQNTADSIAITDDAVWVAGSDLQTVSRIDAGTNEVVTVDVVYVGTRLAADDGGVWVGVDAGLLLRLDPESGAVVATIDIAAPPPDDVSPQPYTGEGAVWVQDPYGVVFRIDPQNNEVTASVDLNEAGIGDARGMASPRGSCGPTRATDR